MMSANQMTISVRVVWVYSLLLEVAGRRLVLADFLALLVLAVDFFAAGFFALVVATEFLLSSGLP